MELVIKDISGKTQLVSVLPSATISDLKQRIAPHFETKASCLKLSASSGQILENDQKTVSDYGLSSGSTVMLLISTPPAPYQVFMKNLNGQIKTYDITKEETVDQFMKKVRNKERTPEDQQWLSYNNQRLERGRSLQDYNILPGSTISQNYRLRGGSGGKK
ncbi:ubiquitin-like protein ISG15 [Clarias gariepinus]|uniref:uncharacterized protein LOC128509443 n=1 Tax=Clarias gariepinus TaxID=13013 RepID=UPI00234CE9DD|nr:uncharacterized protein LOC128509443 [Clarias gariepinus]